MCKLNQDSHNLCTIRIQSGSSVVAQLHIHTMYVRIHVLYSVLTAVVTVFFYPPQLWTEPQAQLWGMLEM